MNITAELLKEAAAGNRKSQHVLYRECFPLLMGVCRRYFQNESDSRAMVNECFLKIILNLQKYQPEVPFKFWIRKIMINTIIDNFRKQKKYREAIMHAEPMQLQAVSNDVVSPHDKYSAEELLNMIRTLPPMTCQVFNLFAIDGYSHFEIAEALGIAEGTSKWHVSAARKQLSEMLSEKSFTLKLKKA